MISFVRKYAKAIVAAIGQVATIVTALGLTHQHWVAIVLGVLSTIAVIITKNTTPAPKTAKAAHHAVRDAARQLMAVDPTASVTIKRGAETESPA